jgi:hypothetical protein
VAGGRRRLFGVVVVGIALLAAGCIPASSPAPAPPTTPAVNTLLAPGANPYGPTEMGQFLAACSKVKTATEDPIVAPGSTTFWHSHDFFGNTSVGPDATTTSMLGQGSSCITAFDTAAYWIPTFSHDGVALNPWFANFYYRVRYPQDPAKVQPMPTGLIMIAGTAGATSAQPTSVVHWSCRDSAAEFSTIPDCGGNNIDMWLTFPECWDGQHLDSANHKSHMAYANGASCPADHPVLLPQLVFQVEWIVPAGGTNTVSSDHAMDGSIQPGGLTAHGDFMDSWNPEAMQQRVNTCLRAAKLCDINGMIVG